MFRIPVISRLTFYEYLSLILTFLFFLFETILRACFFFSPVEWIWNKDEKKQDFTTIQEIVQSWGYPFEEYIVTTEDGYLLSIHRIPGSPEEIENLKESKIKKPVVLLWHGFLMSSEVYVCKPNHLDNLAFLLASKGYDVWLGNTRGNKYALKHQTFHANSIKFWDFSMDELARYDLPNTVEFILQLTKVDKLTYIGFSQGTAMAYAALSINKSLESKINLFIGLAPATAPKGLKNATVDAVVKATPNVIYLLFGRRSALSATLFWQRLLPKNFFVKSIDYSMQFLFGWQSKNMSSITKHYCYQHLYSSTSVKVLVHWFQIMKASRFQFYDDLPKPLLFEEVMVQQVLPAYPTNQIQIPLAIFYGNSDSLSDMEILLKRLPTLVYLKGIEEFEHLDFLWADKAPIECYEEVLKLLDQFSLIQGKLVNSIKLIKN